MSVSGNEPVIDQAALDAAQDLNGQQEVTPGHPAWQVILDALPESLHSVVTPKLKEWDEGVTEKLNTVRSQYDPYKDLIENQVDPVTIQQALAFVQTINDNPLNAVNQIREAFELKDIILKSELDQLALQQPPVARQDPNDPFASEPAQDDFFNDPRFKAMSEQLQSVTNQLKSQAELDEIAQEEAQWNGYLDQLETNHGEFDRDFVTALVAQTGMDGVAAVKQYQNTVNQAAAKLAQQNTKQTQAPVPVVMGSEGTAGAGVATQPIQMGALPRGEINSLVTQILEQANAADAG